MNGDLTAFKRAYTPYVRRCDELEKKLSFFLAEMARYGIEPEEYTQAEFESWAGNQRDTLAEWLQRVPDDDADCVGDARADAEKEADELVEGDASAR